MTREKIFQKVNEMDGAGTDCPFEGDFYTTVLRRTDNGKWFGVAMRAPAKYFYGENATGTVEVLTVKCDPFFRLLLQNTYPDCVFPAYHMNKTLWASVPLESALPAYEYERLLLQAFELVGRKGKKR